MFESIVSHKSQQFDLWKHENPPPKIHLQNTILLLNESTALEGTKKSNILLKDLWIYEVAYTSVSEKNWLMSRFLLNKSRPIAKRFDMAWGIETPAVSFYSSPSNGKWYKSC